MIISLTGGLGNQLFQYYAGLYYNRGTEKLCFTSDLGGPRKTGEVLDLEFFSLNPDTEIVRLSTAGRVARKAANLALTLNLPSREKTLKPVRNILLNAFLPVYFSNHFGRKVSVFSSDAVGYTPRIPSSNSIVFGYFQSHKYYSALPEHKKALKLRNESPEFINLRNRILIENPLVVHVRLGDYLKEKHFGVLTRDYYSKGISRFEKEEGEGRIWLFSDDPVEALQMLPTEKKGKIFVVPNKSVSPAECLELMRYGSRFLIANSSFSWWGAMLSYTKNKRVKAPSKWFSGMKDPHELMPENWELLAR